MIGGVVNLTIMRSIVPTCEMDRAMAMTVRKHRSFLGTVQHGVFVILWAVSFLKDITDPYTLGGCSHQIVID